ncbi:MAG: phosphonate C-P lyase system protein PhnH [Candidatus Eremiobacteraeota bacterium]|nr:phosphonate C-P lyase system protein PhnH [Candidatus Eremiobacteraeota bacterium]
MTSVRDRHRCFRALLNALSYPGRWFATPAENGNDAAALLLASVWEPGVALHRTGSDVELPWQPTLAPPSDADVIVIEGQRAADALANAQRGTDLYPERGATVLWIAGAHEQTAVALEGPGVKGRYETTLPARREDLDTRADACADYPRGIDVVFIAADGSLAALPRTTRVSFA